MPKDGPDRHAAFHSHPSRQFWRQVNRPVHGAVVLMSALEAPRVDQHAGVCLHLPAPVIVHVDDPHGVVADDIMTLRARGWFPTFWIPG